MLLHFIILSCEYGHGDIIIQWRIYTDVSHDGSCVSMLVYLAESFFFVVAFSLSVN